MWTTAASGFQWAEAPALALQDDFSFERKQRRAESPCALCLFNRRLARLPATGTANGWQVKAVRVNGIDVTDKAASISIRRARAASRIELTNRRQQVSGSVSDGSGVRVRITSS
jgi:hypothetical protein